MQNELADEFYREQKFKRDNELAQLHQKKAKDRTTANTILSDLPRDVANYIMQYHDEGPQKTKDHLDIQNNDYTAHNKEKDNKALAFARPGINPTEFWHTGMSHYKYIGDDYLSYHSFQNEAPIRAYHYVQR